MGQKWERCIGCGGTGAQVSYFMGRLSSSMCYGCNGRGGRMIVTPDPPPRSTSRGERRDARAPDEPTEPREPISGADMFAALSGCAAFVAILVVWFRRGSPDGLPAVAAALAAAVVGAFLVMWILAGPLRPAVNFVGRLLRWLIVLTAVGLVVVLVLYLVGAN